MKVSPSEIQQGKLNPENLTEALRTLRDTGYVVLEKILPEDWVATLHEATTEALTAHINAQPDKEAWLEERKSHVGMFAPVTMPFMDPLAIENPLALQVMEGAMGGNLSCSFYNTNNAWPGSGYQHIHRDFGMLFPEFPVPLPVHTVVVNISLVDFTPENGSTEVWPGSHLITDHSLEEPKQLEARAARLPSTRTDMPAGSLVVRDLRMWHRGVPNLSDKPRSMLAIVYKRDFVRVHDQMLIPRTLWDEMSPRAQQLFRHNRIGETES